MSSLRNQITFPPQPAHTTPASRTHSISPPPTKKQRMTLTQTYRLAHRARGKLSSEAARGDHDLRLLVGHANLLDSLMLELQDAERQQDAWFQQSITKPATNAKVTFAPQHSMEEHQLDIPDGSDDEDELELSEDEDEVPAIPTRSSRRTRARSPPAPQRHAVDDEDMDIEEDDEEDDSLSLTRTRSHSPEHMHACPDLVHGSDSSDSDESDEEEGMSKTGSSTAEQLAEQFVIVKDFAAAQAATEQNTNAMVETKDHWMQSSPIVAVC